MSKSLSIEECVNDEKWDKFILSTENKNFYSISDLINSSKFQYKKILIKKSDEIVGSFHFYHNQKSIINGDCIYSPINYKLFDDSTTGSQIYKKFDITNCFIDFIIKDFNMGEFTLDTQTNDLRPFYWYNFDKKKEIFTTKSVRYTSAVSLDNLNNQTQNFQESPVFKNFSRSIKQQYIKSLKENFFVRDEFDTSLAKKIILNTYKRQNIEINYDLDQTLELYQKLERKKLIKMIICSKNSVDISFVIFSTIGDKSIYLHGGRLNDENQDSSLTYNIIQSFNLLKKININYVDLEGVNSPKRGFWKIGFGGELKPYFNLLFKND